MLTLSHGYLKPQNGVDQGVVVFPAMETNIQKMNDHTHNVTANDGAQLAVLTQSILSANWLAAPVGGGVYYQTITMPTGMLYDSTDIFFRLSTGQIFLPTIVRLSATQYNIFINDQSKTVTALYR